MPVICGSAHGMLKHGGLALVLDVYFAWRKPVVDKRFLRGGDKNCQTVMMRKLPRKTVIFFGADGTGKTTQATVVLEEFRRSGFKARKVWIRARHSLAFAISQLLIKLGYPLVFGKQNISAAGISEIKVLDTRDLPAKWLWSLLEFVSVVPLMLIRVHIPLLLGYYIVAERCVIDTIVYNQFFIGNSFDVYARILFRLLPKDALFIHLDAERQDVLMRREGDILPKSFTDYQLMQYRFMATRINALSINTSSNDISEVSRVIINALDTCNPSENIRRVLGPLQCVF